MMNTETHTVSDSDWDAFFEMTYADPMESDQP